MIPVNTTGPLPDTSKWLPRESKTDTLKSAFLNRCIAAETLMRQKTRFEKAMNIDNFDSGSGIEDIIREEMRQLLPMRYSVRAGVINDRFGKTAGDFDLVIFNDQWFPAVKAGATRESRRIHLPIDGVYAVSEIKQSLDFDILDAAMEKLVICHRLHRPPTYAYRLTENRESSPCSHGLTNPLFSMIIATDLREGISLDRLVERFYDINTTLERSEVVRALCILGHGTVTWGYRYEDREIRPARFMLEDLYEPICPIYHKMPQSPSALYALMVDLSLHLYHSILAPEDIVAHYGPTQFNNMVPASFEISLNPDEKRLLRLRTACSGDHGKLSSSKRKISNPNKNKRKGK